MKEFWTATKLYFHFKKNGFKVPSQAYCSYNFLWKELLVNQVEIPDLEVLENLSCIANLLQGYRDSIFKKPIIITSGWRSGKYNKKIEGAQDSYHCKGMALDFIVKDVDCKVIQKLLNPIHQGGMEFAGDWTHIDIRGELIRF